VLASIIVFNYARAFMSDDWFRKYVLGYGWPLHRRFLWALVLVALCLIWALLDGAWHGQ